MNNKVIFLGKSYANEDKGPGRLCLIDSKLRWGTWETVSVLRVNATLSFPRSVSYPLSFVKCKT